MDDLRNSIITQLESIYHYSDKNMEVKMSADIRTVKNLNSVKPTDHIIAICNNSDFEKNTIKGINYSTLADTYPKSLVVRLTPHLANQTISGANKRSIAHEIGHSGGLLDNNDPKNSLNVKSPDVNLMTQIRYLNCDANDAVTLEALQIKLILDNTAVH